MNATTELCPGMKMSHNRNPSYFDNTSGVFTCIFNGLLAIPTTILNFLLIISIISTPSLRKPSYVLICALAFTDFGVGILVQPLYIARKVSFLLSYMDTYCFLLKTGNVVAHIICSPSFFIVTAISIDRYLAIKLRTKYSQVVTNNVIGQYFVCTVVCACCITVARFHATSPKYMGFGAFFLCLFLSIILYCYIKSLKELSAIHVQVVMIGHTAKHRRVLKTLIMVVAALFLCYVPFVIVVISIAVYGRSKAFMVAWDITASLMYINSCINPILHFLRVKELRQKCSTILMYLNSSSRNKSISEQSEGENLEALEKELAALSFKPDYNDVSTEANKNSTATEEMFSASRIPVKAEAFELPEVPIHTPSKADHPLERKREAIKM